MVIGPHLLSRSTRAALVEPQITEFSTPMRIIHVDVQDDITDNHSEPVVNYSLVFETPQ